MAEISVIIPVYKVEKYLHRCVDSILNQSFRDFDLILVDDGSPDNCGVICDEYAAKDSRVHVIHQANGGPSAARNAGIDWSFANSSSRWFAFIDSDDWIHGAFLQTLLEAAETHNASISVCGLLWTDRTCPDHVLNAPEGIPMGAEEAFSRHYEKLVGVCSKIIRKDLFAQIRFPVGKLYEDAFVSHKLLFQGEKVTVFQDCMYYYYYNPDSITRIKWSDRKLDSIEAHELRLQYCRDHGYQTALRREKEAYVEDLMDKIRHLLDTRESEQDHQDTLRMMQEKLRKALAEARAEGLVPFNRENLWCYLYAMKSDVVWKTARSAQKIYHKLKN